MEIRSREIRSRAMDSKYSKGRHYNVNIIGAGRTVADLIIKPREKTTKVYLTINTSQLLFVILQEMFNIDSNFFKI